jgi:hypothetical protein
LIPRASGPQPDLAEDLLLFGQFVGAWEVDVTNIESSDDGATWTTVQEMYAQRANP